MVTTSEDINLSHSNKMDIHAADFNCTKKFDVSDDSIRLSRVDSRNYPEATNNLDEIAKKLRLNKHLNDKYLTLENNSHLSKIDENTHNSEKQTDISVDIIHDIPANKKKKHGLISNIIRRLSKPKGKMSKIAKKESQKENNANPDKVSKHTENSRQKSFRKIFDKLGRKKQKKTSVSEPASSVASSAVHCGLNGEFTASCNDITDNQIKSNISKQPAASAECVLLANGKESRGNSVSTNSEDFLDNEARLFLDSSKKSEPDSLQIPVHNNIASSAVTRCLTDLTVNTTASPQSLDTQLSVHSTMSREAHSAGHSNVKLALALHGYGNYGLRASRNSSRSCMEFRTQGFTSSSGVTTTGVSRSHKVSSEECHRLLISGGDMTDKSERAHTVPTSVLTGPTSTAKTSDLITILESGTTCVSPAISADKTKTSVMLRQGRPGDIQLRRSKGASQTRSSLIMLTVTHNSPRGKLSHGGPTTPTAADLNSSWSGGRTSFTEPSSPPPLPQPGQHRVHLDSELSYTELEASSAADAPRTTSTVSITGDIEPTVAVAGIRDGHFFLAEADRCEHDIMLKVTEFQTILDDDVPMPEDVRDQMFCVVGKSRLLISEKFNQFRGLCAQNLSEEVAPEGYRTLTSDLEGFWSMVMLQVDLIGTEIGAMDLLRNNNWQQQIQPTLEAASTPVRKRRPPASGSAAKKSGPNSANSEKARAAARERLEKFKQRAKVQVRHGEVPSDLILIQ